MVAGTLFSIADLKRPTKRELSRGARTSHQRGYRVVRALPSTKQQHLASVRILENVVDVCKTFHFKKAGPAWIWPRGRACNEKLTQFVNLFLRMIAQIFDQGRLFWDSYRHYVSPPHSAYILLTSKDAETRKMFHGAQQILQTIWPAGFCLSGAGNTRRKSEVHE
jgi:hypothetical protein